MLLMPCNLAHFYWDEVQKAVGIPLLNMVEETVKHIIENYPHCRTIGIVASTPTIESGLYEKAFHRCDRLLLSPEQEEQEDKVMRAIYGQDGIKCGHKTGPRALLNEAARGLVARGAQIIIAGCTEASLVMKQQDSPFTVIDPMEVIARVAVRRAMQGESTTALG
jgi:aspartate racemase